MGGDLRTGVDPPADLGGRSIDERFLRRVIELGDAFEQAVADRLGADRAHALRAFDDGWPGLRLQTQKLLRRPRSADAVTRLCAFGLPRSVRSGRFAARARMG